MTESLLNNQDEFLNNISERLGRERKKQVVKPNWKYRPQWEVLKDATPMKLASEFKKNSMEKTTTVIETTASELAETLRSAISQYSGGRIVTTKDTRFTDYGLESLIVESQAHVWNVEMGDENINIAKSAAVGVFFSDISLAESGTVVQFNDKDIARSVSLLPVAYIAIVPQSTIVPRMTQATQQIQQSVDAGKLLPTCINFISGPSNSADIEMNIVIGVHGPIEAIHVVVVDR